MQKNYQLSLLKCIKAFRGNSIAIAEREVNYNFFKIVTCLIALVHPENTELISPELYEQLELDIKDEANNFSGDLYREICDREPRLWTATSDDACIFITLMRRTSSFTFPANIKVITGILKEVLSNETDPMLRLNVFRELAGCFQNKDLLLNVMKINLPKVSKQLEKLIKGTLHPGKSNLSDINPSQRLSYRHYSGTLALLQKQ